MRNTIAYFIAILCAVSCMITGCATQETPRPNRLPGKIFELQYHAVTGQEYSFQGTRFTVDTPLRAKGATDYFYAIKKGSSPLKSSKKYLLFDMSVHNPHRRMVYMDFNTIELIGSSNARYRPLTKIDPDTNQTRNWLRILDAGNNTPFIYGLIAFEPVPEHEIKLTLRFRIQIDDLIDEHFVIFEKDTPDPEALRDYQEDSEALRERERLIDQYTDEKGYIKPADLPKIQSPD
ncbi:MAG: hypothetical protein RBU23_12400 [Candidatus Auribacterota bacterium]|nr:hypothetical protein [Candidatus Auribacterota bacterium]